MEKVIQIQDQLKGKSQARGRGNIVFGFIGTTRTGKTSKAIELAKAWKEARPNCDVICFDPQDQFKKQFVTINGVQEPLIDYEIKVYEEDEWEDKVLEFENVLIILDDYRMLHTKSTMSKGFLKIMYMRAKRNYDIIYIIHNPQLILNQLTFYTTHYFIFHTLSTKDAFQKKIPNYERCQAALFQVNKFVEKHGAGKYPKFPYIVVNTMTQEMTAYNMTL